MRLSGRLIKVVLLAGIAGMVGCGAPPGDASRSSSDDASGSSPSEFDDGGIDDPQTDTGAGAGGATMSTGSVDDPPEGFEPESAAPAVPDESPEPTFETNSVGTTEAPGAEAPPPVLRTRTRSSSPGSGIQMKPSVPPTTNGGPPPRDPPAAADGFALEKVYYGTDREPEVTVSERWGAYGRALRRFQILLVVGLALCGTMFFMPQRRVLVILPAVVCLAGSAWSGREAMLEYQQAQRDEANQNRRYGNGIHFANGRHVLERGYCWVSVPVKVHRRGSGELEEPGLFEVQENPDKHFTLQRVQQVDRASFLEDLRAAVRNSGSKHAFVFIHGYNVLFREAALRTAQLRYDLDFDGPAAFFSWPSNGSILSYASDEETVNLTERSGVLHDFLTDFINETGAESIHLIAHSMGNRLMTRAFEKLPQKTNSRGHKTINQLVMAAPDVNPAEFMLLADRIRQLTRARTLYASEKDIALIGSEVLRMSNYTRLGQGGQSRVIVDGVQTIDASDLDQELFDLGHSYYVHPLVIRDLKHLLNTAEVSQLRPWLMAVDDYWIFRDD